MRTLMVIILWVRPHHSVSSRLSTMNVKVLSIVLEDFPPMEQLQLRLVCKKWDRAIGESKLLQRLIFNVDKHEDAIDAFRFLSPSLKLRHFRFANLTLDAGLLLGDTEFRRTFFQRECPRIKTIYLINCVLFSSRFLELISHCPRITELMIQQCPSIYHTDMAAFQWAFDVKSGSQNLGGLKVLKLMENFISEQSLYGLTCGMRSLKSVTVTVDDAVLLPRHAIINLVKNNCESLEEIFLWGALFPEKISINDFLQLEDFPEMSALRSIVLQKAQLNTMQHSMILEKLLKRCPKLSQLRLTHVALEPDTLSNSGQCLTMLELGNISFDRATFKYPRLSRLQILRIIQFEDYSPLATEEAIVDLLQGDMPQLEVLELRLLTGENAVLMVLTAMARLPSLKCLWLRDFKDIGKCGLKRLFKKFAKLEELALINCETLGDECFCTELGGDDAMSSLANLTNLRVLNLAGTSISYRTIDECVLFSMDKLEVLNLAYTTMNNEDLEGIMSGIKCGLLPRLHYLELTGSACLFSDKEFDFMMVSIAPRYVNIKI